MLNPAHILETAFLLLAAFLIGAVIGSLAKLLVLRLRPVKPAVAATVTGVAEAVAEQTALVAAPVIEPTARPAQPEAPAEVPTPDFSEVAKAIAAAKSDIAPLSEIRMPKVALTPSIRADAPAPTMAPAHEAGKATSGKQVQSPRVTDEVADAPAVATGPGADVIPFPVERTALAAEVAPEPVPAEELAKAVDVEVVDKAQEPAAAVAEIPKQELPDAPEPIVVAAVVPPEPAPVVVEVAPESAPAAEAEKASAPEAVDAKASVPHEDETAAMRAIEGTWTPRRNAGRRTTKAPAPEGVADEVVVADALVVAEPPGRPAGLPAPRGGVKDNLTNVIGVLPVIETSLNSIGVYHFDQVGAFSDENVAWLEGHLGIGGRIDREHWREQARELAVISDRARKVAGQQ